MSCQSFVLKVLFCFCTVSLLVSSGPWADEKGLVGYWTFNDMQGDEVADISGGGNNGKCFNNPQNVAGVDGIALSFEGKDDYVEVPHAAALDFGDEKDNYTIAFWFRSSQPAVDPPDAHFLTKNAMPYSFRFVQNIRREYSVPDV